MIGIKINLSRFDARELASLMALFTVCLVVLIVAIGMIFRQPQPEGRQAIYQLASGLVGLAAGLLGGGTAGFALARPAPAENVEKQDGVDAKPIS